MSRVVLGVTGGVAAFRAADLVGRLRDAGIETRVAMTRAATRFVTPLTFSALSGHEVLVDDLDGDGPAIRHIEFARFAEAVVVAPATADFIARVAHGLASDGLTTMLLALEATKPVLLCPAMNAVMWAHPMVQRNVERILDVHGERYRFLGPVEKRLACGEYGAGGMAGTEEIVAACRDMLAEAP